MHKQKLGKILSAVLCAALALSLSSAALAAEGETHITIIGTSDTHGNIWGYSYEDMTESSDNGLARISTYVNQVRAENPNTILVDAGDTIQGTIMTDDLYSEDTADHPVPAALNYMGYDAWTLGNHEFNFGVDTLQSILEPTAAISPARATPLWSGAALTWPSSASPPPTFPSGTAPSRALPS